MMQAARVRKTKILGTMTGRMHYVIVCNSMVYVVASISRELVLTGWRCEDEWGLVAADSSRPRDPRHVHRDRVEAVSFTLY